MDTHTYEQFLMMRVGLGLGLVLMLSFISVLCFFSDLVQTTPWAIKRSQVIFVCILVKNQQILMQF